ncbi:hypothetical protein FRC06_005158 [Ceratobasidium sp. 370]|nr:hypothetical protein FRC06_005158 [Ceratobasidium sp. 370]
MATQEDLSGTGVMAFLLDVASSANRGLRNTIERVIEPWVFNEELFRQSDLVVFTLEAPTTMLLASEFSTRPLGKPLPQVNQVCRCVVLADDKQGEAWVVEHNARHGCSVEDVKLTAKCSLCGTTWPLESSDLEAEIYARYGRYSVNVSYNGQRGWHHD